MGRTIKLLLYYFAYQFAFMGVIIFGYMIYHHTSDMPDTSSGIGLNLMLWAQVLATMALGIHLLVVKYVPLDAKTWAYAGSGKILLTSILFVVGMGLWTNYLNEQLALPDNLQELFAKMMHHPLGILSITVLAPVVEELLFRGAIQGHLLRTWKNPMWAIVTTALIFGLVHGNPAQIPFAFVLGVALGWMYYRTGSLLPGILMHFINNTTAVYLFLLSGNSEATMNDMFGVGGAAGIAVLGLILTIVSVRIVKRLVPQPAVWREEEHQLLVEEAAEITTED